MHRVLAAPLVHAWGTSSTASIMQVWPIGAGMQILVHSGCMWLCLLMRTGANGTGGLSGLFVHVCTCKFSCSFSLQAAKWERLGTSIIEDILNNSCLG